MLSNAAHPEDKRGESNLKSAIIIRRWSNELTSSNLNKTKYHQLQSYTVKSECWSGSLYLEVVFRWQPLHCTTSSQQSVHVFRSDQPGQEIKENTTFTFDIQHCLTCAHDYASLQQHIQAAQTFQPRDKDKWTHRVLMINLSCDDQIFECQTHNLLATADQLTWD